MGERLTYASVAVYRFAPSPTGPFSFTPTLDGQVYAVTCPWNLFGQRYYVTVRTLQGLRICTVPLVGSPNDYDINILGGYFTTLLVFRADQQSFEVLSSPVEAAA